MVVLNIGYIKFLNDQILIFNINYRVYSHMFRFMYSLLVVLQSNRKMPDLTRIGLDNF